MNSEHERLPIAERLAELRKKLGLNMRQLAKASGASTSLISQVETGKTNPTVGKLQDIATALGVPVSYFFESHDGDVGPEQAAEAEPSASTGNDGRHHHRGPAQRPHVVRGAPRPEPPHHPTPLSRLGVVHRENRATFELQDGVIWERLSLGGHPEIEFLEVTYPAGTNSGERTYHYGHEFIFVLEGELEVEFAFDRYLLGENDSIAFDSMIPHRVSNTKDGPMRAIWVNWSRPPEPAV